MSNFIRNFLNNCTQFKQTHHPDSCLLCQQPSTQGSVCAACQDDLPWAQAGACPGCGLGDGLHGLCSSCTRQPPAYDAVHAAFRYAFPVDQLITRLKYRNEPGLGAWLGDTLARRLPIPNLDLLLPMPLHADRLRERGYNQAMELARPISHHWGCPIRTHACTRQRFQHAQAGLHRAQRQHNVSQQFACPQPLHGLRIAVVDDVMTSGATLQEVAQTLKAAGAARVEAWVVARALPPGHSAAH